MTDLTTPISRRRALAVGGGFAAGGLLSAAPLSAVAQARPASARTKSGKLPVKQIQEILRAQGTVTSEVLSIPISRSDIGDVAGPLGVTFDGSFEIDGALTFQPLGAGNAFFNGDIPVKPEEANPFIDALIANGLIFQAFHQHFIEMSPQIWFIHFRGHGNAIRLAQSIHRALEATSTPFPQTLPANPTTPLDPHRLASILDGQAQVGDQGVVTVNVNRRGPIRIGDVVASPEANISTGIEFKPRSSTESDAAAAPDFSMDGHEVMPVVTRMRKLGWFVGCLYNQETQEHPQLFFSHMLKTGDAYTLAREIRSGLDLTDAAGS